jgi:hypothetical protein
MSKTNVIISPTPDKAVVCFMRPSGFRSNIVINVYDGDKVIGNSFAKYQFDYLVNPGKHLFVAVTNMDNTAFMEAELEAGKTYYVLAQVLDVDTKEIVDLTPVNVGSALWDKVKEYENSLGKTQPNVAALNAWDMKYKTRINTILAQYETTPKTSGQSPRLNIEDGR